MEYTDRIARVISKARALEFIEYKHPRLGVSFYNIDLSVLFNFPDLMREVIELLENFIKERVSLDEVDFVGGILTKGVVYASIIAYRLNKPIVIFNKRGRKIYGGLQTNDRVLLVDDMIMTGTTILKCIKAVRNVIGGDVKDAVVILDRMCGGVEKVASKGVKIHAMANIKQVAEVLLGIGDIDREQFEIIMSEIR